MLNISPKLWGLCLWAFTLFAICIPIFKAQAQEASSNRGTLIVKLRTSSPDLERRFGVYMDTEICGSSRITQPLQRGPKGELSDALVWLEGTAIKNEVYAPRGSAGLHIKDCQFTSNFVFAAVGESLVITSEDAINFDLSFVTPDKKHFSRSLPPNLKNISVEFEKTGIVEIGCALHPWMKAYAVIPTHPFFSVTDKAGELKFPSVPAGSYQLHLWHGNLGKKIYGVEVKINKGVTTLELDWESL